MYIKKMKGRRENNAWPFEGGRSYTFMTGRL